MNLLACLSLTSPINYMRSTEESPSTKNEQSLVPEPNFLKTTFLKHFVNLCNVARQESV